MKLRTALLAVAASVALGASAGALDGAYESNGVTMTFNADGTYTVVIPAANATVNMTYTQEGDTVTIAPVGEDAFCAGATGTYTVVETDADVTFTKVDDACEQRATTMAATWPKKAAE